MANLQELNQAREKYLDSMNRVNLLLLKEHDLNKDELIYKEELEKVENLISSIQNGRENGLNVLAEDTYLRNTFKQNQKQIKKLTRKMMQGEELFEHTNVLKQQQAKYIAMMSQQFQTGIQHKLSTIRGKVDELKKKIKQINKQTLNYEQEHQEVLDNYSFNMKILSNEKKKSIDLQARIAETKAKMKI